MSSHRPPSSVKRQGRTVTGTPGSHLATPQFNQPGLLVSPDQGQGPARALGSFFTSASPGLANYRSGAGSQAESAQGRVETKRQGPSLASPWEPAGLPRTAGGPPSSARTC